MRQPLWKPTAPVGGATSTCPHIALTLAGIAPSQVLETLEHMALGFSPSEVFEGERRFAAVVGNRTKPQNTEQDENDTSKTSTHSRIL